MFPCSPALKTHVLKALGPGWKSRLQVDLSMWLLWREGTSISKRMRSQRWVLETDIFIKTDDEDTGMCMEEEAMWRHKKGDQLFSVQGIVGFAPTNECSYKLVLQVLGYPNSHAERIVASVVRMLDFESRISWTTGALSSIALLLGVCINSCGVSHFLWT